MRPPGRRGHRAVARRSHRSPGAVLLSALGCAEASNLGGLRPVPGSAAAGSRGVSREPGHLPKLAPCGRCGCRAACCHPCPVCPWCEAACSELISSPPTLPPIPPFPPKREGAEGAIDGGSACVPPSGSSPSESSSPLTPSLSPDGGEGTPRTRPYGREEVSPQMRPHKGAEGAPPSRPHRGKKPLATLGVLP